MSWLAAFVWTLVLEYPVFQWALGSGTRRWWHPAACTLALNLLTHPLFSIWLLSEPRSHVALVAAELWIVVVEALALAWLPWNDLRGGGGAGRQWNFLRCRPCVPGGPRTLTHVARRSDGNARVHCSRSPCPSR